MAEFVKREHGCEGNLALYFDDQMRGRERPQRIGNHLPDLYAEDVPRTFVVIGEAKTHLDLITPRSRRQLGTFVQHLALYDLAYFYLAVPALAKPAATSLVRELGCRHKSVKMQILTTDIGY
ncbi:hypothetical protein [Thiosulfatihalobacter marinus]|uniref:hypothetical protein n=1 Tax=Thiosulfatihalobacter marinus TaxID=2792481 RepID=UPI0018D87CB1|nr:hypothetical protein [Thiosulfatihalobacter marinus]